MLSLGWIAWIPPRLPGFRVGRPSNFGGRLFVGDLRRGALSVFSTDLLNSLVLLHCFLLSLVLFQNLIDHIFGLYTIRVIWSNKKESNKLVYF